jgi:DNA ligase (NAD+)
MSQAARAEELRALIREASHRYYVLDDPSVDDAVYDDWVRELEVSADCSRTLAAATKVQGSTESVRRQS